MTDYAVVKLMKIAPRGFLTRAALFFALLIYFAFILLC